MGCSVGLAKRYGTIKSRMGETTPPRSDLLKSAAYVQVLVRAFAIPDVLARRPAGVSLGDPSRLAGVHKSTAFRMLRKMTMLGCVARAEDSKHYRIGDRMPAITARRFCRRRCVRRVSPTRRRTTPCRSTRRGFPFARSSARSRSVRACRRMCKGPNGSQASSPAAHSVRS
ncbi:MAG: helix-turn-helix domain-containing protein [Alphaproteobacteria bacterium]|nr:helix-turn-helix domain-containing protein [Alphaproteobacteria bacterium]